MASELDPSPVSRLLAVHAAKRRDQALLWSVHQLVRTLHVFTYGDDHVLER